jgi:hypothetical protein
MICMAVEWDAVAGGWQFAAYVPANRVYPPSEALALGPHWWPDRFVPFNGGNLYVLASP